MRRIAALLLLLLTLALAAATASAGFRPPLDADLQYMLNDSLAGAVHNLQVPGAVMAVKDARGNVAYFHQGLADIATGQEMDPAMYFRIASITKTFTATAILTLVDQNKVGLTDTVEMWLPGKVDGGATVTVQNLLEMRSGLEHFESSATLSHLIDTEPDHQFTLDEYLSYTNKVLAAPGAVYDYNNLNYLILQSIIEKASGRDYQSYFQDRLITPLGLSQTMVPYNNGLPSPYAHGYRLNDGPQPEDCTFRYATSAFGGAGSMVSTAGDLVKWLDALVDGSLLSVTSHRAQWDTKADGGGGGMSYGLGVARDGNTYGHNGNYNNTYTSAMFRYLGYDIVILANGQTQFSTGSSSATSIYSAVRTSLDQYLMRWD
ncbi:MAG: beta-lactamase family protein [Desulfarculus sp.]|nr:beta-lactamase family protein [Desulfarculus sp.]